MNVSTSVNLSSNCHFTRILIRYFGIFIFLMGILSTGFSICVFARKPLRRKSCCFYFLILAISDSIHLSTMIIENLPYSFNQDLTVIHTSICKITIFLIYFSNHLSNIILTLASVDRFILIYTPSRSKRYCTIEKGKWMICIVILILFIGNGHILFGFEKIQLDENQFNESFECYIRKENIFYNKFYYIYDTYIESIFFVIIPFIIMLICSILIIIQIFETRKTIRYNTKGRFYYYTFYTSETIRQKVRKTLQEQGSTRLRDKDIQLCCMLIGTTFAFLILCLPTELNDLFHYIGRERSCSDWFKKVLLMLMQQIYYAGHFYIYILTGQLFRKHLYMILFGSRDNEEDRSLLGRFLSTFSNKYQRYRNQQHNRESNTSFATTTFINTSTHRPSTKTVPLNDPNSSTDPSRRLLLNIK